MKAAKAKDEHDKRHRFPYEWLLREAIFTKDKGKVFSCFACGGGSTMGYKLAGFDVLGCNEIDPRMMAVYKVNHHPRFSYEESIVTLKARADLPDELFHLDILDGSPPCSSFSMSGNREKDWGEKKVFSEGQAEQILDTLFFDFIDLGERLRPKVIVAENVKGLILGNAKAYVVKIHRAFAKAGYASQHFLLNASKMGVPQRRERVFFLALRNDLFMRTTSYSDLFNLIPQIDMTFDERPIVFADIYNPSATSDKRNFLQPSGRARWDKRQFDDINLASGDMRLRDKGSFFNWVLAHKQRVLPTIAATAASRPVLYDEPRKLDTLELCRAGTFPVDYNFLQFDPGYLIGMSVPPVMTAQIATRIYNQWLSKFKDE